jgi:hypothetical protein
VVGTLVVVIYVDAMLCLASGNYFMKAKSVVVSAVATEVYEFAGFLCFISFQVV